MIQNRLKCQSKELTDNWIHETLFDSSLYQLVFNSHQSLFILWWLSESKVNSHSIQSDYDSSFFHYSSNSSKFVFNSYSFNSSSSYCYMFSCSFFHSKETTKITVRNEDDCDRIEMWTNLFIIIFHSISLCLRRMRDGFVIAETRQLFILSTIDNRFLLSF